MTRRPDYILDISTLRRSPAPAAPDTTLRGRPWIAVYWKCCHRYSRIYRNRDATAYAGRCPACHRHAVATVGPDGTNARFFEAT